MKQTQINILRKITIGLSSLSILSYLIYKGYNQSWTGLQGYTNSKGEVIPSKKLWDWLQLLVVPILLAIGAWWLNKAQKKSEQQLETDRQRQKALEDYFDCMTNLLLKESLREPVIGREARVIARTRTLAVLRILDGGRKAQALQFLYEAGLIDKDPVISLNGADFSNAELAGSTLQGAELRGVYFNNAQFIQGNLTDTDLRGSDFSNADMTQVRLVNANLTQANLRDAKLCGADLTNAVTEDAHLNKADITDAIPLKNQLR